MVTLGRHGAVALVVDGDLIRHPAERMLDDHATTPATPVEVAERALEAIAARGDDGVWISVTPRDRLLAEARSIEQRRRAGESLSLYGLSFAVKDNIDVAGLPTTAACPAFSTVPTKHATVVARLLDAGALCCVGKTSLDQFATGLGGVRSPYGVARNLFDPAYVVGGSSSGSGVAVAAGSRRLRARDRHRRFGAGSRRPSTTSSA